MINRSIISTLGAKMMTGQKSQAFIKSLLLCLLSFTSAITAADDTEVFFASGTSSGDTRPNVMFVLDTSGSMGARDGGDETRLDRMKNAVRQMLESDVDMNIGLMNYSGSDGGGPVLYPITTLNKEVCAGYDCEGPEAPADNTYLVDGSLGDVEERVHDGDMLTGGIRMDFATVDGPTLNALGLRYAGVNIARGATILDARLEFVAQSEQTSDLELIIQVENVADSEPYGENDYSVSGRTYDNSATVEWVPDEWFDQSVYQSPDVGELVQGIVDKDDWCNGNALAFYVHGTGGTRIAYTYDKAMADGTPDYIPKLRIIQDPSTVVPEDNCGSTTISSQISASEDDAEQHVSGAWYRNDGTILDTSITTGSPNEETVGMRFRNLAIPQGATIQNAFIRFHMASDSIGTVIGEFYGEDTVEPPPYTTESTGPSSASRNYLPNPVLWDNIPARSANEIMDTVDLSSIVQTLVNDSNWDPSSSTNAINLMFKSTGGTGGADGKGGERDYKSFENNASQAPELFVTFAHDGSGSPGSPAISERVTFTVTGRYDEAEQHVDGGSWNRSDKDLDIEFNDEDTRTVGLRFTSVDIPKGVVIDAAYIKLWSYMEKSDYHGSDPISLDIYVEDSVSTDNYGDSDNGPMSPSRTYRSGTVPWSVPPLDEYEIEYTPDIKSLVQPLVDKSSWSNSGNDISFLLRPTSGNGERSFVAEPHGLGPTTQLIVDYTIPAVAPDAPTPPPTTATPAYSGDTGIPVYSTKKARDEMLAVVDGLFAAHATPTVDAFYEAALYMRGENVDYGKQRGIDNDHHPREKFSVSHEDSYTGGTLVRDEDCTDDNLTSSKCRTERITGTPTYISPIVGSCQANHIVLLSDGETNNNSSTSKILSMTSRTTCKETGDEACATDLAEWLVDTDHSDFGDFQNITTHTIAFNLEGAGKSFLERVAAAGGGNSYEADTSEELLGVFNDLVTNVFDIETGFTAPSATVNQYNRLTHRDDLYFAVFKPADSADWDGNIKRFRLGTDGSDSSLEVIRDLDGSAAVDPVTGFFDSNARSWWPEKDDAGVDVTAPDGNIVARGGAANQLALDGLEGIGDRRVYTWLNDASTIITTPIDLTAENQKLHESNSLITDEILGISGKKSDATEQDEYKQTLIQWARGVDVQDSDEDGSRTDIRRSMGDPMHSRPALVNYAPTTSGGDVRSLIYVGTNEGYLHAFDASNGQEQFAYVPYELLDNLDTFFENKLGYDRPYGLDGPVSVWRDDTNNNQMVDSGESAYLFVGMRRGGNSYYALDISDPYNPKLAWTIKGGPDGTPGFEDLGQSWSRMTPVQMYISGTPENVLVFGGGYDVNQDKGGSTSSSHTPDNVGNSIYIVRATDRELLWSGVVHGDGSYQFTDMDYGFNGNIRTIDINRDGYVDQMYAADVGGRLWRFDIAQYHSGEPDSLVDGGVIAELSDFLARDHRRFYNEPDVALIEGGGEKFLSVSIGSGWRAHPLDETTEDRFYMVKQYDVYEKPDSYSVIDESDLINVTDSVNPSSNEYGWYLRLENSGEKVLGTSVTFDNKVIFSSYLPAAETAACSAEIGSGRAYILDVATGAPAVDLDDSSETDSSVSPVLDLSDRSLELNRTGIPPEAIVVITENGPQVLIGGEQLNSGIENATRRTFWSDEGEDGEIVSSAND